MNRPVTTRRSTSCGPRGRFLTTAPPAAPTSCSTTAWSLSLKTSRGQLKAQEPFLLTCWRGSPAASTFWRGGISLIPLSGNRRLGTHCVHASLGFSSASRRARSLCNLGTSAHSAETPVWNDSS